MTNKDSNKGSIKTSIDELRKLIDIKNCIGETIETEDKLLIPVSRVGFAFGVGSKENEREMNGGAGIGAIDPISLVVINKGGNGTEGIRVLSLSKASELNKAIVDLGLVVGDIVKEAVSVMQIDDTPKKVTNTEENKKVIDIE